MGEYEYDNIEQFLELPELEEWDYEELEDGHRLERSEKKTHKVEWEYKEEENETRISFRGYDVEPNLSVLVDIRPLDSRMVFEVLRFVRVVNVWYDETEKYDY